MKKRTASALILMIAGTILLITPVFSVQMEESKLARVGKRDKPLLDPFAFRISVTRKVVVETKPSGPNSQSPPADTEDKAKKNIIKLEGIWIDATMRVAIISGQALEEGGQVLGWRLVKIYKERVVLSRDGQTKILLLEVIR